MQKGSCVPCGKLLGCCGVPHEVTLLFYDPSIQSWRSCEQSVGKANTLVSWIVSSTLIGGMFYAQCNQGFNVTGRSSANQVLRGIRHLCRLSPREDGGVSLQLLHLLSNARWEHSLLTCLPLARLHVANIQFLQSFL